jgi:hypothetical protein
LQRTGIRLLKCAYQGYGKARFVFNSAQQWKATAVFNKQFDTGRSKAGYCQRLIKGLSLDIIVNENPNRLQLQGYKAAA